MTMRTKSSLAVIAVLAVAPASATAQEARQSYTAAFTTSTPSSPSGLLIGFDYRDPADPAGKPPAVARVVQELHAGARIDTGVPERCTASDAQLMAQGPSACPAGSRVGAGTLHADTGAPGGPLPRVAEFRVTLINAPEQLILFLEGQNLPSQTRLVSRSRVTAPRTYTSETPPLPSPDADDPYTAIKHVRLAIDEITRDGRGYITTPARCPAPGAWSTRGTFTYRDGVTERVVHPSRCVGSDATPARGAAPAGRAHLVVARPPASAAGLNRRRGIGVALRVDGVVRDVTVRLVERRTRRTVAAVRTGDLRRDTRLLLRRQRRAGPGRHEVVVTATAGDHAIRTTRSVLLRR